MADNIYGKHDTLHENLIIGAKLTGRYDFPVLPPVNIIPKEMIPFSEAKKDKRPYENAVHFFIDDVRFESFWNNPEQHFQYLRNFKAICGPDYSNYLDMPAPCRIWNVYRSRALSFYLTFKGCSVIPTAQWMDEESYDWIFDGLPKHSTIAVSTNGCFFPAGRHYYISGMLAMEEILQPTRILCVGRPITVPGLKTELIYYDSFGQRMERRIKGLEDNQDDDTAVDAPAAGNSATQNEIFKRSVTSTIKGDSDHAEGEYKT